MDVTRPYAEGTRVESVDLSRLRLHEVSLEGTRVTDAVLTGADLDGDIVGLRVNGIEIAPLVEAELDRRHPQRILLRAEDLPSLREGGALLEREWSALTERAGDLGDQGQRTSVDGEWSFVQTLRHLIFATDCWLRRAVLLDPAPYHPWGLPSGGFDPDFCAAVGVDPAADPGLAEVLPVRRDRQDAVRTTLDRLAPEELAEERTAPASAGHPTGTRSVMRCLHVLLREEWSHLRYATRDLDLLDPTRPVAP